MLTVEQAKNLYPSCFGNSNPSPQFWKNALALKAITAIAQLIVTLASPYEKKLESMPENITLYILQLLEFKFKPVNLKHLKNLEEISHPENEYQTYIQTTKYEIEAEIAEKLPGLDYLSNFEQYHDKYSTPDFNQAAAKKIAEEIVQICQKIDMKQNSDLQLTEKLQILITSKKEQFSNQSYLKTSNEMKELSQSSKSEIAEEPNSVEMTTFSCSA